MRDMEYQLSNKLAKMGANRDYNPTSLKIALEYLKTKQSEGLSAGRLRRIADVESHLLGAFHSDFSKLDQKQLEEMAIWINSNKEWKEWTAYTYIAVLKNMANWLNERYGLILITRKVKAKSVKNTIMPEYLLTENDLNKIINATDNMQLKLLIGLLYESGARIGEILTLQLQNVSFNTYGARISVKGKTGQRVIPIIWYANQLRQYMESHPFSDNSSALLWFLREATK